MKFGSALCKLLSPHNQSAPCIADVHATYKAGKKLLKQRDCASLSRLVADKVAAWNESFLDAEEDLVMECAGLQELCAELGADPDVALLQSLVDYHGRSAARTRLKLTLRWASGPLRGAARHVR